ncbi:MAG: histidine phosphotransferase family protein [Sedimentitalea sp.]
MGDNSANLAALIGSRICHDLISPIGAITNGLELLDLSGSLQGPEMDLISDSVGNAGARIRFFRVAYGAAGDQMMGPAEIRALMADISRGGRLNLIWDSDAMHQRAEVRLAFLAIQCCETALPYGGTITISEDNGWYVDGMASKINHDDALWANLSKPGHNDDVTPAQVQFALLPHIASELGRSVQTSHTSESVSIRF